MPPAEVDAHEMWEIAGYLGCNRAPEDKPPEDSTDLLAQRVKAAKTGKPLDPRSIVKPTQVSTLRDEPR